MPYNKNVFVLLALTFTLKCVLTFVEFLQKKWFDFIHYKVVNFLIEILI